MAKDGQHRTTWRAALLSGDETPRAAAAGWRLPFEPRTLAAGGCAALVMLALWWVAAGHYHDRVIQDHKLAVSMRATSLASTLSEAIGVRFGLLRGLAAFVDADLVRRPAGDLPDDFAERFHAYVAPLHASVPGIRNLTVAPGAVQRFVHPFAGNEPVLGHDLLKDARPEIADSVRRAVDTGEVVLSGPLALRQGGTGIVARFAVRRQGAFWGLVTMVVDIPTVLSRSGVLAQGSDLIIGLRAGQGQLFFGGPEVTEGDPVARTIALPEGRWELLAAPRQGWDRAVADSMRRFHLAFLAAGLLVIGMVALTVNRHVHLARALGLEGALLRRTEASLQMLVDNAPSAIALRDPGGRHIMVNRRFEGTYGIPRDVARGREIPAVFDGALAETLAGDHRQALAGAEVHAERRIDGEVPRTLLTTMFPMRDEAGRVFAVGDIGHDITEWKRAQEDLRAAAQARIAAEVESRAKSAFLANMSHELRTPLNAILGFSDAILSGVLGPMSPERFHSYVEHIHVSGQHLLALINNILDLSKIEAGRLEPRPASFDIAATVRAAATAAQPLADKNGNRLDVAVEGELGSMVADEVWLRQVLLNLLGNACKFTEAGTVRLSAKAEADWLVFAIEDTGIGIAADDLSRLFEDFSRVGAPMLSRGEREGSGLGLSISRRLCQLMGGSIGVESVPGRGSTFTVRLPRGDGADNGAEHAECACTASDPPASYPA